MRTSSPILIASEWFDRLWAQRDPSVIDELRAPDAKSVGLESNPLEGRESFRNFHARALEVFAKTRVEILDAIESGDRCAVLARFYGTTKKGVEVTVEGGGHLRIVDGKVATGHNVWNVGAAAKALGLPACGTFDELLAHLR